MIEKSIFLMQMGTYLIKQFMFTVYCIKCISLHEILKKLQKKNGCQFQCWNRDIILLSLKIGLSCLWLKSVFFFPFSFVVFQLLLITCKYFYYVCDSIKHIIKKIKNKKVLLSLGQQWGRTPDLEILRKLGGGGGRVYQDWRFRELEHYLSHFHRNTNLQYSHGAYMSWYCEG